MTDELSKLPKPNIPGVELIEIMNVGDKRALVVKSTKDNTAKHKGEIEKYINEVMLIMKSMGIQKVCFKE